MDTSQVVNPAAHLRGEIKALSDHLDEISGNIATLYVQQARLAAVRDAMEAGAKVLYGEPEVEGQMALGLSS